MIITSTEILILFLIMFCLMLILIYVIHLMQIPEDYQPVDELFDSHSVKPYVEYNDTLLNDNKEKIEEYYENE